MRGIYRAELDEEGARAIGRAYVEQFSPQRIAVGRDMRLSSPTMAAALIEGAAAAGADVLDIGLVGTEMVYFAVGELGLDGGVMVTASHNPKEYTGMKIVRAGALPVGGDSGLLDVRDRAVARPGLTPWVRPLSRPGAVSEPRHLAGVRRARPVVHRPGRAPAAQGRDRRRERHGRRDAPAGARAPADRAGGVLLRARRELPEPRAEPAAAREPRVHRRARRSRRAPTSASPSTATPTAASSSTTPASSSPATSPPRSSPRASSRRSPARR